ncbi:MAG: hypothetical protein H6623_04220 [Bdellovibrionaceae bacterium]|nr:hypothetical protein [Pseudobdellovibrionaceae bacterium]
MKIWYSPYELFPIHTINRFSPRDHIGFLIKIQNKHIEAGYADCRPIVEFGDGHFKVLLQRLREKKWTPLLKRAVHLAQIDGKARMEKRSLFFPDIKVRSHFTCTNIEKLRSQHIEALVESGFKSIKVKVGKNIDLETTILNRLPDSVRQSLRWRFDANAGDGEQFLTKLSPDFFPITDFFEDPTRYNLKKWQALSTRYHMKFAFDHPQGATSLSQYPGIHVLKPAREAIMPRKIDVITSAMDHPVGQSFAFWAAQTAVKKFRRQSTDYGLQTDHLFRENPFFKAIRPQGSFFQYDDGYGVGFNELLESVTWLSL